MLLNSNHVELFSAHTLIHGSRGGECPDSKSWSSHGCGRWPKLCAAPASRKLRELGSSSQLPEHLSRRMLCPDRGQPRQPDPEPILELNLGRRAHQSRPSRLSYADPQPATTSQPTGFSATPMTPRAIFANQSDRCQVKSQICPLWGRLLASAGAGTARLVRRQFHVQSFLQCPQSPCFNVLDLNKRRSWMPGCVRSFLETQSPHNKPNNLSSQPRIYAYNYKPSEFITKVSPRIPQRTTTKTKQGGCFFTRFPSLFCREVGGARLKSPRRKIQLNGWCCNAGSSSKMCWNKNFRC